MSPQAMMGSRCHAHSFRNRGSQNIVLQFTVASMFAKQQMILKLEMQR